MNSQAPVMTCEQAVESIRFCMEGELPAEAVKNLQQHLAGCKTCRREFNMRGQVLKLLGNTYAQKKISEEFDTSANRRLVNMRETASPPALNSVAAGAEKIDDTFLDQDSTTEERRGGMVGLLGMAPWWGVSIAMHGLVMMLAGLVSMSMNMPQGEESVVMMTELQPRPQVDTEPEKQKNESKNVLESDHDTPPTDPTSAEASDIVVPPEILAKAELGDHFETINPDRPDTQSAFGNPDAHMFHSEKGNDEPAGGGGVGGTSLDDVIGVGGAGSPGTGGGWGGGNGTGIGTDTGSGRGSFGRRDGGGRRLMVKRHGGSKATENAVDRGLDWLARHQEADGRWSVKNTEGQGDWDPGVTGLAVLAFLGAGHTEKVGRYKENVRKAIAWMITQQRADGALGTDKKWTENHGGYGYHHAICGLALAEAAGMARVPETVEAAQKALDYTSNEYQCGAGSEKLGWRYVPKAAEGDVSVSGWYVMQLKSAKIAGLKVDAMSFEGALKFLDSREQKADQVKKEADGYDNGRYRYGYTTPGAMVNTTAIGILCQLFCGTKPDEVRGAASWLLRTNPPEWKATLGVANAGGWPMYYTYYTTLVMFQVGGDHWKQWNEAMKKMLLDNQRKGGDADGSWDPLSDWEKNAGRAYTTALGALSMEVYYRYNKLSGK